VSTYSISLDLVPFVTLPIPMCNSMEKEARIPRPPRHVTIPCYQINPKLSFIHITKLPPILPFPAPSTTTPPSPPPASLRRHPSSSSSIAALHAVHPAPQGPPHTHSRDTPPHPLSKSCPPAPQQSVCSHADNTRTDTRHVCTCSSAARQGIPPASAGGCTAHTAFFCMYLGAGMVRWPTHFFFSGWYCAVKT